MNFKAFNANPKTTYLGMLAGIPQIVAGLHLALSSPDGFDMATFLNADGVMPAFTLILTGLATIAMGYVARDADKSSQDSRVRLPVKPEAVDTAAISDATTDAAVDQSLGRR